MLEKKERKLNSVDLVFNKKEKQIYWEVILRAGEYQKGKKKKEA